MAHGPGMVASGACCCWVKIVTPELWKQVEAVFEQAVDLPSGERRAFLDANCSGDEKLRREVESLIESDATADNLTERGNVFCNILEEDGTTRRRGQLVGHYRIVYRVGQRQIVVLTVFEGHRLLPIGRTLASRP